MRSRVIPWHFTAVLMMLSACSDGASVSQADQSQAYATILEALPYAPVTQLEPEPYSPTLLANGLTVSVTGSHRPGSATSVCRG